MRSSRSRVGDLNLSARRNKPESVTISIGLMFSEFCLAGSLNSHLMRNLTGQLNMQLYITRRL
jgi:hypothetical protein